MKKFLTLSLLIGTTLVSGAVVFAQSLPTLDTAANMVTISQPYQASQCIEPDGTQVYLTKHFYFGDTYTTRDFVPKRGSNYDTLLLNNSRVLVFNPSLFNWGSSPIKWKSNGVPDSLSVPYIVATSGTFQVASTSPGQLVYNIYRAALENAGHTSYTISYLPNFIGATTQTTTLTNKTFYNLPGWVVNGYECVNYNVHYCGDGVVDTQQSIANLPGGIVNSIASEQCDGTAGVPVGYTCNSSCQLVPIAVPTCTLTVNPTSVSPNTQANVNRAINGAYTNTPQITYTPISPSITGLPYTIPAANGNRTITPTGPGTFTLSMTVSNSAGSSTCTATLNVGTVPSCTLTPQMQTGACGTTFTLNYSSANTTSISNLINISGGIIQPNQAGAFSVSPLVGTTYSFHVNGAPGTTGATCSAYINVTPNPQPHCVIAATPQTIFLGQSGVIGWGSFDVQSITNLINIPAGNVQPNISGSLVVYPTQTTTYGFTAVGAACTTPAVCSTTITVLPVANANLRIDKKLIVNEAYHSGDLVSWRIDFGNNGSGIAHNVVLTDYLPESLHYVSSQIFGVTPPYTFGTGMLGPNVGIIYSGFNLAPGQNGYLIITGRLFSYDFCNATVNNAFIESTEIQPPRYDSDYFMCYAPTANLTIDKTINKQNFYLNEYINFTIAVTNNGPDVAQTVRIGDIRPNTSCIIPSATRTSNLPMTLTNGNNPYERTLNTPLSVGQTLYLYLTGQVANNGACAGNYLNTGTLTYTINNQIRTGQDMVPFTILGTPVSSISFNKSIIQAGYAPGDTVIFALDYANNGGVTLSSYSVVDYRPGTLTFLSASPMPASQIVVPGGQILNRYFTTPLAPGGTGRIILNGKIH